MNRAPVALLGLTLRQLIGGRWAVSLLLFAIYVPIGIMATIGNLSSTVPGTTMTELLTASTLSLIPVGLLLWISAITWLRGRREHPVPIITVICLGAAIGVARSASMYALSVSMGIQEPDTLLAWTRLITGTVQGATTYPLGVLAIALVATYREQRRSLLARQVSWEARRLQDAREWEALRAEVITPIASELTALGDELDREVITSDSAASSVRARAHELWGNAQPSPLMPRVRLSATIVRSLQIRPFATWLILLMWFPTALGTSLGVGELPRAPLGTLLAAGLLVIIFEVANAITARLPALWWLTLPFGLALAIATTSPSLGIFGAPAAPGTGEFTVINAVWLTLLVVLTSIVVGALRRGEVILAELHTAVDAASVETLAQEDRRRRVMHEVAATLHGTLQGRLASLPRSDNAGDAVRETLALLRSGGPITRSMPLDEVTMLALEQWLPLVAITHDCSDDIVPASVAQSISEALEECVSNAFRHGHAHRVHCQIDVVADTVAMIITDDGRGDDLAEGPPGLGSRILDRCGEWTRVRGDDGTTVCITIPI